LKSILSALYNHAIRYEWLNFNPISRVRTSSKPLREKDVLTPEEFQRLAEQHSVRYRAMVLLAGSTGLRRSEMIALTWSDLDPRKMEVNGARLSNAPVFRLRLVVDLSYERSRIGREAAGSGGGGEAGCGV
jgi:integrase